MDRTGQVITDAGNDVSTCYIAAMVGYPAYAGFNTNLNHFQYAGIEAPGFWSKAWQLVRGDLPEVEDTFQEIVLGAIEVVVADEAREQGPTGYLELLGAVVPPPFTKAIDRGTGFLLQKATWMAQNRRRRERQAYMVETHNIRVMSLDVEIDNLEDGTLSGHEAVAAPVVDSDMKIAVRQIVDRIESETTYQVAALLMEGMSKCAIAEQLGVTPAAITHQVRKLRDLLGDAIT